MQQTTLQIDGMTCGQCVARVQKALTGLDGVTVERVSVGSATIDYDASRVSGVQLDAAIDAAGYTVRRGEGARA